MRHQVSGELAFMSVAQYLRYVKGLTGTKIVCSEGDCGACTILESRLVSGKLTSYKSINSCISYMFLMDKCHLITVEGLEVNGHLHEVQTKMVEHHGSQCGYCTPGFVCAMANMAEDLKTNLKNNTEQKVKNYLTGNLCRCTGYKPIIEAGKNIDLSKVELLGGIYNDKKIAQAFLEDAQEEVLIYTDEQSLFLPSHFHQLVKYKEENPGVKIVSGATDLGVLKNKGKVSFNKIISLNNLSEAYQIKHTSESIEIGAKVSLTNIESECRDDFPEFSRMLHIFASPQIKNSGTLIGNLINASPIADTIPFLMVSEAKIELVSAAGTRILDVNDFIRKGYKNLDIKEKEFATKNLIPKSNHEYKLYKVSVRKDLDISSVTMACRYKISKHKITSISFAFGGVGPSVLRLPTLAKRALYQVFRQSLFKELSLHIGKEITPMSDHRGSREFREVICQNLLLKFCDEVMIENGLNFSEASL
jgi:xanthine dehydrogenase small subunit